jgi:hypothetical protein
MENQKDWILSTISIHQDWSKKGVYKGSAKFQNGLSLEFSMLLDESKCLKMVQLLKDEIVESAKVIGEQMVASMPVSLPPATTSLNETDSQNK